ncbi:MAG: hypothetical protein P1V35_11420, partial [Planctomycetota bacterium]|nr:hypothetical protein [Planctomycetota bacterium]
MPKENQKKLLLLPLILLLIGAGVAFMNRGTDEGVQEPAMAPESGAEPAAAVEQPLVADIQSPEIVVRQPEAHVEPKAEPESEPPPMQAAPSGSYRLLSRTLQVPLSHSFLLQIDATEEPIAVGAGGVFEPLGGHLPQRATLLDYTQEVRLGDSVRLKILPESQVLYSDLCTLLLDAPAGPLPAIDELHAAFLSKSGRLQPTPVRSVESRPGGWTVRIEEPVDFCAEVSMDRALLCIDPPTKDHVRLATWTLAELKRAKANELRPLPTRSIALRWKGLETMGNLADRQELGATFFTGHCEVPGFQSPNALDWLASPPKRSFQSKRTERTYVRVPECITGCTAFFGMGSVASVDLPAVEDWKFGVELFAEALELQESQINNPALPPAATFITLNPMGLGNPLLSG